MKVLFCIVPRYNALVTDMVVLEVQLRLKENGTKTKPVEIHYIPAEEQELFDDDEIHEI